MNCPYCGTESTRVVSSRKLKAGDQVERRRKCGECGQRFKTRESVHRDRLLVVKRNGGRQEFSRQKIAQGLMRACNKRPVGFEQIDRVARDVEQWALKSSQALTTRRIGEEVLARLRELDDVACIRFASVLDAFESADDFLREMRTLFDGKKGTPLTSIPASPDSDAELLRPDTDDDEPEAPQSDPELLAVGGDA